MKNKILAAFFSFAAFQLQAQVSWQKMASLPGAGRDHAIAFSHGTNGYITSGENNGTQYKDFWEYNSLTNTWTQLPSYPGPARSYGVGYVINEKAFIGFGHTGSTFLTDWWQYDFTTSTWSQKNNFPGAGRDHPCCAIMNGKLYMGFGDNNSGSIKDWWQYDPVPDSWSAKANYPGLKMHHPVTAQDNSLIYLSEGHLVSGSTNSGSTKFYSYNDATDSWATLADMPGPGVVAGASFYIGDNNVYSGAGITEPANSFHTEFYAYAISAGTWSAIASYPGTGVFGPVSFVIGNAGYVVTGMNSSGTDVKDLYKLYSPSTGITETRPLQEISLYPNPAVSTFSIAGITDAEKIHYSLLNLMGEELRSGTISAGGNYFTEKVQVNDLAAGIYFLQITDGKNIVTKKIIKKKE